MRFKALLFVLFLSGLWPISASARNRFIVRYTAGLSDLKEACEKLDCTVVSNVDGDQNEIFLLTASSKINPSDLVAKLLHTHGVTSAELDQAVALDRGLNQATAIPAGLLDTRPVQYFGSSVWHGYVDQPAAEIVRVSRAQSKFHVDGTGVIVADIGTGVDPNHPALQGVLLPGWDFTRNLQGGWETRDFEPGFSPPPCPECPVAIVNQSTAAVLDQSTAALLGGNSEYAAFGHGTMVMGIIHLVAPQAMLLPLKAFHADGTAFLSDILSAIYFAVANQAKVINMSFDLEANSPQLTHALDFARRRNVICTASVGNDGQMVVVYPAALQGDVMGVASTNNLDQRSTFSNFGDAIVWVAAPGESVISTFPFGTFGASWGTSFSAPFVAGAAALLLNQRPDTNESQAAAALAHAVPIGPNMGNGRVDLVQALAANSALGPDFNLAESDQPNTQIHRGEEGTFTFNVEALQGFTGTVDVTVEGLPSKASADIDPRVITGAGGFELTLEVDEDTPPGLYPLTITGRSGSLLHSVFILLQVR
jgi:subtilisin family serine protease